MLNSYVFGGKISVISISDTPLFGIAKLFEKWKTINTFAMASRNRNLLNVETKKLERLFFFLFIGRRKNNTI